MKRLLRIVLLIVVLLANMGITNAQITSGHIIYTVMDANVFESDEVRADGADCYINTALDIPYKFSRGTHQYLVTSIGIGAFQQQGITALEISPAMRSIGNSAFQFCSEMKSITWRRGLKFIEQLAFNGCSGLEGDLVFPESVKLIGDWAFSQCSHIGSVTLSDELETLGIGAFHYCFALRSVEFTGHKLGYIPDECFNSCGLENVTLPVNMRVIGRNSFAWCEKLKSISWPATVVEIGNNAFEQCCALTDLYCYSKQPPMTQGSFNEYQYRNTRLHVPSTSRHLYQTQGEWSNFANIIGDL